jgi:hypothetical protein
MRLPLDRLGDRHLDDADPWHEALEIRVLAREDLKGRDGVQA